MLERGEGTPHAVAHEKNAHRAQEDAPISLSSEINAATRHLHTTLNRLITSRLPLALPPHATDASPYATGLLHFAHIFLTFESLWADLLRDHGTRAPSATSPPTSPLLSYLLVNPYDSSSLFTSTLGAPTPPSPRLVSFLRTLRPHGLLRSVRVKRDLAKLLALHPTDLEVLLAKYPGDRVAEFCTHIRKAVHEKPWTLVSYAWCFYMAVFSGGRWIRAGLLKAGPDFWQPKGCDDKDTTSNLAKCGLSFWHFPGQFDGEDIKVEFKARLAAAETLFTLDERVDIIEEAKTIFQLCATLVQELDAMFGTNSASDANSNPQSAGLKALEPDKDSLIHQQVNKVAQLPSAHLVGFVRKPEVTGIIVAVGCLACVALLRLQ